MSLKRWLMLPRRLRTDGWSKMLDDVSYTRFVTDLAEALETIRQKSKRMLSQRQAYRMFGQANVKRWRDEGLVTAHKRPGKIEYSYRELLTCQQRVQDYL